MLAAAAIQAYKNTLEKRKTEKKSKEVRDKKRCRLRQKRKCAKRTHAKQNANACNQKKVKLTYVTTEKPYQSKMD